MYKAVLGSAAILVVYAVCFQAAGQNPSSSARPAAAAALAQRGVLDKYCVTCHNDKLKTAGLSLEKLDLAAVPDSAAIWEKVIAKVRAGAMPPAGRPRPEQAEYDSLATYLETTLDNATLAKPNPGRPAVHRLNRTEYANAVRDLLALDFDGQSLLPPDDAGHGFDNNADVLSSSPFLLDRYLSAAGLISRVAIGDATMRMPATRYDVSKVSAQNESPSEDLPFGSRGGIAVRHFFPLDGEYLLRIRLQFLDKESVKELLEPHVLDVRLDGTRVKMFTFGGTLNGSPNDFRPGEYGDQGIEVRFHAKTGMHLLGVTFQNEETLWEGMLRPSYVRLQQEGLGRKVNNKSNPAVDGITILGPYGAKVAEDTPSGRKIFVCRPARAADEEACAKKILSTLARSAYRRPVTDVDIQGLLGLYRAGRTDGFEAGIRRALQGILLSREFLFRVEREPANVAPGVAYRISDLELASRLSFFLWSSIPDEPLLSLAEKGMLRNPGVLEQQVRRMTADPRSKALTDNFAGQWLNLRSMETVSPETGAFPAFDEELRKAMAKEMELFFDANVREDRSVLELLNASDTFVNERLARHYGIPNIYGTRFRRVTLKDENRWGLLGKGAILTVTSFPGRTSVVERGKWVLENILNAPPPPPPPNVPALDVPSFGVDRVPLRQRMEKHRANPVCASCHAQMDPIGFALENFDGVGGFRTAMGADKLDVAGVLPDGTKFEGPAELRKILMSHPERFAATVADRLLTYALGRAVDYYDQPAVRVIVREAAANNYRWSSFILGIIKSVPFQQRLSAARTSVATVH